MHTSTRRVRLLLPGLFAAALVAVPAPAQVVKVDGPKPRFEVATIKPNKSGEVGGYLGPQPGGRLVGTNQSVQNLIRNAFNVQPYQMAGGPGWIDDDRFDILAKAAEADLDAKGMMPFRETMLRLQALLEDRFGMVTHWETREMPIYTLVPAHADGRFGPQLRRHDGECGRARGSAPPVPGAPAVNCGTRANRTPEGARVTAHGITMETLARHLATAAGRYVVDRTALEGMFDLDLQFTPDQSALVPGPSLFTAVQEQLGLKLESTRGPIEVLVIDRVERPTPD